MKNGKILMVGNERAGYLYSVGGRIKFGETSEEAGVFRHFTEDCKCSSSMTARIDVTDLVEYSRQTETKFYKFSVCAFKGAEFERRLQDGVSLTVGGTDML